MLNALSQIRISPSDLTRRCVLPGNGQDVTDSVYRQLPSLVRWFRVSPRIYFYDDGDALNAFATTNSFGNPGDFSGSMAGYGTVLFGLNLAALEFRRDGQTALWGTGSPSMGAVFAHEFAHITQFQRGSRLPTVKLKELHADFLAGRYVGYAMREERARGDEMKLFNAFYHRGDSNFDSESHHGTKAERLAAFLEGFRQDGLARIDAAYASGEQYVARNFTLAGRTVPKEEGLSRDQVIAKYLVRQMSWHRGVPSGDGRVIWEILEYRPDYTFTLKVRSFKDWFDNRTLSETQGGWQVADGAVYHRISQTTDRAWQSGTTWVAVVKTINDDVFRFSKDRSPDVHTFKAPGGN
jgi:hypothetical protein